MCLYEREILNSRGWFFLWGTLAFLAPIFAVALCYLLNMPNSWVPRGGAVMAGLAFLADIKAAGMSDVFKPNGFVGQDFGGLREKYSDQIRWCRKFSGALILIGTAVWGFGDLIPVGSR